MVNRNFLCLKHRYKLRRKIKLKIVTAVICFWRNVVLKKKSHTYIRIQNIKVNYYVLFN